MTVSVSRPLQNIPAPRSDKPASKPKLPIHQPGPVRDYVEKTGGIIGAVGRVPGSFLSGVLVGGYHGLRRGTEEN